MFQKNDATRLILAFDVKMAERIGWWSRPELFSRLQKFNLRPASGTCQEDQASERKHASARFWNDGIPQILEEGLIQP